MTVDSAKLIRMGEQVVANMRFTDDEATTIAGVRDHLARFWDPRMLEAIKTQIDHADDVSDTLRSAVKML